MSTTNNDSVARVSVKPPPFWRKDVSAWFIQFEAQFNVANITDEKTKFFYILAALDPEIIAEVRDIASSPPSANPYDALKKRLLSIFTPTEEEKLQCLLTGVQLGDRLPSSLLREMRHLAGTNTTDKFIKVLFMQRLPAHCRTLLLTSQEPLDALADMADKLVRDQGSANCDAVRGVQSSEVASLANEITRLQEAVKNLTFKKRNRSPSPYKRGPSKSPTPMCWYHEKFGSNARRCTEPCQFQPKNANNRH